MNIAFQASPFKAPRVSCLAARSAAQDTRHETHFKRQKKSGFSSSLGSLSYGKSALKQTSDNQRVTQVASTLSGTNVSLASGRDTVLRAGNLLADRDATLLAGRNVEILAAANTQALETHSKSSSSSVGLIPDTFGKMTIYGKNSARQDTTGSIIEQSTSLVSANTGNVTIRAGLDEQHKGTGQGTLTTQGADLLAGKTITLSASAIDLQAVANESASHSVSKSKSLTIGARPAGAIGEKIAAIGDAVERALQTDNSRLQGALALKAGYDAYKLTQGQNTPKTVPTGSETSPGAGATNTSPGASNSGGSVPGAGSGVASSGIGVSVSINSSTSKSETTTHDRQVTGTNLQANAIDITATETDLTMAAAKLQATTIDLSAERDILLIAAANTSDIQSRNKSSSTGFGVTFAFGGQQSGLSFQISASQAKGRTNGNESVWDNTQITASDTLTLSSGRHTALVGAQVAGKTVSLDVGGDLLIQTLQDSSTYVSKQTSTGFNVSICWFFCAGIPVTGSISASSQKIKHNYLSAVGQSGIAAGEGGFDINVGQRTALIGAALTGRLQRNSTRLSRAAPPSKASRYRLASRVPGKAARRKSSSANGNRHD